MNHHQQIIFLCVITLFTFTVEFLIFNFIHPYLLPDLILLTIIFMDLAFGVRYAIGAAILGGLLRDCYGVQTGGSHVLIYMAMAYVALLIRKTIYMRGSDFSRYLMVTTLAFLFIILKVLFFEGAPTQKMMLLSLKGIWIQFILTILISNHIFRGFRKCVSMFFGF